MLLLVVLCVLLWMLIIILQISICIYSISPQAKILEDAAKGAKERASECHIIVW